MELSFLRSLEIWQRSIIMADGLTLPYAELINWQDAVLIREESMATNPRALQRSLPTNRTIIERMRRKALEIHQQYFETEEKRALAALKSASVLAERPHQSPHGHTQGDAANARNHRRSQHVYHLQEHVYNVHGGLLRHSR